MSNRLEIRATSRQRPLIVAGVMSGTSADGADVAICRVSPGLEHFPAQRRPQSSLDKALSVAASGLKARSIPAWGEAPGIASQRTQSAEGATHKSGATSAISESVTPRVKVLAHRAFPYPAKLRAAVLAAMDAKSTTAAELARLSWRLGAFYADAIARTVDDLQVTPQLVACHGQTIYHQGAAATYLGTPVRCTWQIGEASVIAERLRVPVVSDFRPADMAAGGQAAPLVPMLDYCTFRHATKNRLLLNLGGIANVTAVPAGAALDGVLAFDTGPANMVIDALMQQSFGKRFDRNGATAARGRVLLDVIAKFQTMPYFSALPPKSCGREEFGEAFAARFAQACNDAGAGPQDVIATATAFTGRTVLEAYRRFVWPHMGQRAPAARATEMFVAGGGARNATLMRMLGDGFSSLGVKLQTTEAAGLAIEAKEAAAFALLGWLTWHGLPGNVPSATGANRAVVLGKVTLV